MPELGWPKTPSEVIYYIIWSGLVLGFASQFAIAFVHEEWGRALFSFAAMAGLAAMAYYSKDLKSWLAKTNPNYVLPVFILFLASLIFSPFVEQRRWPFASWLVVAPVPSADEIAEMVVHKLPSANMPTPATIAPLAAPTSFVSPIHEKSSKWDIAQGVRIAIMRNGLNPECHITIVRESDGYAKDYDADFREILDVINWKVDGEHLGPVDKEITIRAISASPSKDCAEVLAERIGNIGRTRKGSNLGSPLRLFSESDAPIYIKQCTSVCCIEVDFGLEDTAR